MCGCVVCVCARARVHLAEDISRMISDGVGSLSGGMEWRWGRTIGYIGGMPAGVDNESRQRTKYEEVIGSVHTVKSTHGQVNTRQHNTTRHGRRTKASAAVALQLPPCTQSRCARTPRPLARCRSRCRRTATWPRNPNICEQTNKKHRDVQPRHVRMHTRSNSLGIARLAVIVVRVQTLQSVHRAGTVR